MPIDSENLALKGLDDLFSTEENRQEEQREQVQQIPIDALHPFTNHPFKVLDDEAMTRTVESIAQYGVLAPLIARPRPDGDGYEIISGHRRQYAAKLAGLDTLPVIVRQMSDDAAVILMVDSNLQREHMIYAQRPDATACADFDIWNNRMNRYVRRGAKGIALLDESSGFPRLHYVFDVSDTGVRRNSRDPEMWQYNDDLKHPVSEMLTATYGISGERVSQQLADVAGKLVADYWDNNGGDIRAIVDGSLLMDYDEAGVEMQFKSAAAISVTYTLLERCGFEPAGWFDKDDFQAIYNFSTPDSVYALGVAVSDMSREVLRNIERTVKTTIRRRNAERSQYEYEQQERDLLDRRGLPAPEPDPEPAPEAAGQVRQAAPDLPEGAAPGAVPHDAPEREPVPAPDGGGADGREPDAANHGAALVVRRNRQYPAEREAHRL